MTSSLLPQLDRELGPVALYRHVGTGELRIIRNDGLSFRVQPWQDLVSLLRQARQVGDGCRQMERMDGTPWHGSEQLWRWPDPHQWIVVAVKIEAKVSASQDGRCPLCGK